MRYRGVFDCQTLTALYRDVRISRHYPLDAAEVSQEVVWAVSDILGGLSAELLQRAERRVELALWCELPFG